MKKIASFMLLVVAMFTTTILMSCGDDNDNPKTPSVAGVYNGKDVLKISLGKDYSATADGAKYDISENKDGSLNIVFPEEDFDFTGQGAPFGKIVQGTYVVKNIPYDKAKNAYYVDYSGKVRVDVTLNGTKNNYEITSGILTVTFNGNNVNVVNEHKFKGMPPALTMTGTFEGVK